MNYFDRTESRQLKNTDPWYIPPYQPLYTPEAVSATKLKAQPTPGLENRKYIHSYVIACIIAIAFLILDAVGFKLPYLIHVINNLRSIYIKRRMEHMLYSDKVIMRHVNKIIEMIGGKNKNPNTSSKRKKVCSKRCSKKVAKAAKTAPKMSKKNSTEYVPIGTDGTTHTNANVPLPKSCWSKARSELSKVHGALQTEQNKRTIYSYIHKQLPTRIGAGNLCLKDIKDNRHEPAGVRLVVSLVMWLTKPLTDFFTNPVFQRREMNSIIDELPIKFKRSFSVDMLLKLRKGFKDGSGRGRPRVLRDERQLDSEDVETALKIATGGIREAIPSDNRIRLPIKNNKGTEGVYVTKDEIRISRDQWRSFLLQYFPKKRITYELYKKFKGTKLKNLSLDMGNYLKKRIMKILHLEYRIYQLKGWSWDGKRIRMLQKIPNKEKIDTALYERLYTEVFGRATL
jgi:hypothetical protein